MTLRRRQQVLLGTVFILSSIVDTGHGFAGFFGEEPPPGPKDKEAEAGVDIIPNPGTVADALLSGVKSAVGAIGDNTDGGDGDSDGDDVEDGSGGGVLAFITDIMGGGNSDANGVEVMGDIVSALTTNEASDSGTSATSSSSGGGSTRRTRNLIRGVKK